MPKAVVTVALLFRKVRSRALRRSRLLTVVVSAYAAIAAMAAQATIHAEAASLKRVGNGMIQLHVYGMRLVFREKDAAGIQFEAERCVGQAVFATLARWLADDAVQACLDQYFPDNDVGNTRGLKLGTFLNIEKDLAFPGGIPATLLPNLPPSPSTLEIGFANIYVMSPYCRVPASTKPDALGFSSRSPDRADGVRDWSEYSLPAELRLGHATRPLCIICSSHFWGLCWVALRSVDKRTSILLSWRRPDRPEPTSMWMTYDLAAREIAQSVFPDLPGEFQ